MSDPADGSGRSFLESLSAAPKNPWPQGLVHHGVRIVLLLGLTVLVTVLFPPTVQITSVSRYEVGMVADETITARTPFSVPKSEEELARERADARASVPPTFNYRSQAVDTMVARLDRFFQRVDSAAEADDSTALVRVLEQNSIPLTPAQRELLQNAPTFNQIRRTALRSAREVLPEGVADGSQLGELETTTLTVREGPEQERSVPRDEVMSPREFYDRAVELLPPAAPPDVQETLRLILIQFVEHTLELNITATQLDRDATARAVPVGRRDVLRDEVIVRAGDRVTEEILDELNAYQDQLRAQGELEREGVDLTPLVGAGLLNLLLLLLFGLPIYFFRREVYTNARWILLVTLLVAAYMGSAALIVRNGLAYELFPIAFVALTIAVLWDARMALLLAAALAVLTAVQPPFQGAVVSVLATSLLGGAAAALTVRAVRRRAQAWLFGAIIAATYAATLLALALLNPSEPGDVLTAMGFAAVNAFLSAILAMGFLPVFELLTGITTDQTLLEWADTNRSLLKRLSMEAPGTYAHTINVANLAESAATAVGANGLLCRVGLYYHDVGKMIKPHYFVENQPEGRNPHDRLKPDTSAAIVKEHVTGGLELAKEANLPEAMACFIPEHHGTQRIGFFWERAKEEYGEESLDPDDFRYPGPKPQSRETAIAMLADSVESATRALQDPTPERVRGLIDNIVDGKIADGQLDEAPLTLREIATIKEQFVKVLSSIYHHRIDYPQTKHLTDSPEADPKEGGAEDGGEAAPVAGTEADDDAAIPDGGFETDAVSKRDVPPG